jgi:hypothetical protein
MWQVYLYLANDHQVRERQRARATSRARRWPFGRRASEQTSSARRDARATSPSAS